MRFNFMWWLFKYSNFKNLKTQNDEESDLTFEPQTQSQTSLVLSHRKLWRIILLLFLKLFEEGKLVKSDNLFLFNIKSINPMQIIHFYSINISCNMFVSYHRFLFFEKGLYSNYQSMWHYHHLHSKLSNEFLLIILLSFITYALFFILGVLYFKLKLHVLKRGQEIYFSILFLHLQLFS